MSVPCSDSTFLSSLDIPMDNASLSLESQVESVAPSSIAERLRAGAAAPC